jgi:glycosyltransferase involved in cell wall biosynthesis
VDREDGVLFSPNDEGSLQQSIEYLMDHPEQRTAFGRKSRNKITSTYTWQKNAERIVSIVANLHM